MIVLDFRNMYCGDKSKGTNCGLPIIRPYEPVERAHISPAFDVILGGPLLCEATFRVSVHHHVGHLCTWSNEKVGLLAA